MPAKKYIVRMTDEERPLCEDALKRNSAVSQKARRAHILLRADINGPDAWIDRDIAKTCRCCAATVENVRRHYALEGFKRALDGKHRATSPVPKLLDSEQEAQVIALRLGPPPEGYSKWSVRLLARHVGQLGIVDSISHETIERQPGVSWQVIATVARCTPKSSYLKVSRDSYRRIHDRLDSITQICNSSVGNDIVAGKRQWSK